MNDQPLPFERADGVSQDHLKPEDYEKSAFESYLTSLNWLGNEFNDVTNADLAMGAVAVMLLNEDNSDSFTDERSRELVLSCYEEVKLEPFRTLIRMHHNSTLVFLSAIFDSFLHITTRFLLLLDPIKAYPKKEILWSEFIDRPRAIIINEQIEKKALSLSHTGWENRLKIIYDLANWIRTMDQLTSAKLSEYSERRNSLLHNRSNFVLYKDWDESVKLLEIVQGKKVVPVSHLLRCFDASMWFRYAANRSHILPW